MRATAFFLLSFSISYPVSRVSSCSIMSSTSFTTITKITVEDVRFPTSRELDGSDAMNPDP